MLLFLSLILSKTCFGQIKPCYGFGSDFMRNKCPCDPKRESERLLWIKLHMLNRFLLHGRP